MYKVGDRVKLDMSSLCHDSRSIVRHSEQEGSDPERAFNIVRVADYGDGLKIMLEITEGHCACRQSGAVGWWVSASSLMRASAVYIGGE